MPEGLATASRAAPVGAVPPLGQDQHTFRPSPAASSPRFRPRICLRKGCGRMYQPQRWNQRYCQDAQCLKAMRRWQAAKRQQQRRSRPEVRQERAAEARERRARHREEGRAAGRATSATPSDSAWSRSKKKSGPVCDRPGCYEAPRPCCRCTARYCTDACRQAMRRTCDRERKWLCRKTVAGRFKRRLEYEARRAARRGGAAKSTHAAAGGQARAVVNYGIGDAAALSCGDPKGVSAHVDDRETPAGARPRAPPTS